MTPRQASVDWVSRTLAEYLGEREEHAREHAENLVAAAEAMAIHTEELIEWIYTAEAHSLADFHDFASQAAEIREGEGGRP